MIKYILVSICILLFPISHIIQIIKIKKEKSASSISLTTFLGFFIGNIAGFIYTNKYKDARPYISYIVTSLLEIYIVYITLKKNKKQESVKKILMVSIIILFVIGLLMFYCHLKNLIISDYAGIIPAIIFPLATFVEYIKLLRGGNKKHDKGSSCLSWIMMLFGNIGLYFLADKLIEFSSLLAFVLTAIIDMLIIIELKRQGLCNILKNYT